MDFKLELVAIPVTGIARAKSFYADEVGFHPDHDVTVSDEIRFRAAHAVRIGLFDRPGERTGSTRRRVPSKVSSSSGQTSTPPAVS
jgi:catechol 2,3-dioxygenase-like lactoylglutathione lyase family enzyme